LLWAAATSASVTIAAHAAPNAAPASIGRNATPAEVRAWDIDVRADFKGLPKGAGSVALGDKVWEAKCASCHAAFGESNEVFTPLVGGTTKQDIETGLDANLAHNGLPQRSTLMKVSKVSTLWDYINRAMPWDAPKSLSADEVYDVLAYLLNLGEIVPADFVLSDRNIARVQERLPNRNGKVVQPDMWHAWCWRCGEPAVHERLPDPGRGGGQPARRGARHRHVEADTRGMIRWIAGGER